MSISTFRSMIGAVITSITGSVGSEKMIFHSKDGRKFVFEHWQSCCENVSIDDICGDISDLLNSPLLEAEEVSNVDGPKVEYESYTWTFYRFSTARGSVTVKWLGTSNGYYSESVSFVEEPAEENKDEDYKPLIPNNPIPSNINIEDNTDPPANSFIDFENQWKRICKKITALNMGYDIYLHYYTDQPGNEKWVIMKGYSKNSNGSAIFASYSVSDLLNKYEKSLDNLIQDKKKKLQEEMSKFNF